MKNVFKLFILTIVLISVISKYNEFNLEQNSLKDETIHNINEEVLDSLDYKKAEFKSQATDTNHYFKYDITDMPTSKISAFRIEFDQFSDLAKEKYNVYCTSVSSSTSDSELISTLKQLDDSKSSCVGGFSDFGRYDGIVKHDGTKLKVAIMLISNAGIQFTGRLFFRTVERILDTGETKPMDAETYSLIPYTVNVTKFRELSKSKILFYSYTRELQMYYVETSSPYPEKLFSGNIMSVFTNPNMVRQKYHGASTMILLTSPFGAYEMVGEPFKYQVILFDSNYLLDYFVSSNENGRPIQSPLLINMTECTNPYYVILNYNRQESSKILVLDQIYGKLSSLSVATKFTKTTWEQMLEKDLEPVDIKLRKYILPSNSRTHIDVYKIECELPLMLNFYYTEDSGLIPKMNYGDVNIFTLKPYETVNIPFFKDVILPKVIIEIYNPNTKPIVIVEVQEETVYQKNTLIEVTPMTLEEGINIKERGGLNDTRIIVKIGYSSSGWIDTSNEYIKYNSEYETYLFEFPNGQNRYNFTYADLITSGTNPDDNVKYCITTNIGAALKPSSENCYRVSQSNSYTLKVYNPLVMYKDYEYDSELSYYVTFKLVTAVERFDVKTDMHKYDTTVRNYEGINNKIVIDNTEDYSSILTPPEDEDPNIFIQVQVCDNVNEIKTKVINPLNGEIILDEEKIEAGAKNKYMSFKNNLMDTEFFVTGKEGTNVFIRMVGLPSVYIPSFNNNYQVTFDEKTNTLNVETPITKTEYMKYTVLVDKDGVISNKGFTLCTFVNTKIESLALYTKSIISNNKITSLQLNFNKAGIKPGEKFEAIVYIEQQEQSQMVFLSDIYKGTVSEIDIDTISEINEVYSSDDNYFYKSIEASSTDMNYYFSYLPSDKLEVPIGAFSIELDQSTTGGFTGVACTFVDEGTDAMSMIEAAESAIEEDKSFCIGSKSSVNPKRYNYIFKYQYDENIQKRMVIKVSNGNYVNGKFNIYMKKDQGVSIEKTDFTTLKEYGQDEDNKKSVIPYIVDLIKIRDESAGDYKISKVLFYSQHLEMQMYYIPEDGNIPVKLFSGNIALVYTKPELAVQKYHATTLVLISENLEGQEHPSLGDKFRFHTKMFKSDAQIEYFMSQNPEGRTLNFPLSLEMNICIKTTNDKLYYILNYNKPEPERTLHLDMIFGSYLKARIAREINADNWDLLVSNSMSDINNYQTNLPEKSQHIDVIEIECKSPLLLNAYYTYDNYPYTNVKQGEIVVKNLPAENSFSFSIDRTNSTLFYYSLSLFNPTETPSVTVHFSDGTEHYISENSLKTGMLLSTPEKVSVTSNCKSQTRFIFKIGFDVEKGGDWHEVEEGQYLEGTLYANINKYVYKFPVEENKKNFTKIKFLVNSINQEENVKFCYSTNLGLPIEASKENCFRTGRYIPYSLEFINPLIVGKNYKTETDKYYISFRPFNDSEFINIEVTEGQYETKNRNDEGVHKLNSLNNGRANFILSLPEKETSKILVQIKPCKDNINPITYINYNAFTQEQLSSGSIDYTDKYGVYFFSTNTYLENEVKLTGESGIDVFTKHAGVGEYSPKIVNYYTSFDSTSNAASIIKPISDEEFNITVIVGPKGTLSSVTQCDLAFKDKKSYGDYSNTFVSVSSNIIIHYIDFAYLGYNEGTEFDLLVYAEQTYNSKMEFIYPVITGTVGRISGVIEINEYIENNKYATKSFKMNSISNYLYYDFPKIPVGNIASLKVTSKVGKVSKVGCVFTSKYALDDVMVSEVNRAVLEGKSVCIGEMQKDNDGYDALIKVDYTTNNNRLVIQILYGLGEEYKDINKKDLNDDEANVTINIKISGVEIGESQMRFGDSETISTIPYVIDLLKIREKKIGNDDYVSKILFYSNTREMEMFYIDKNSPAPISLFTGNIMLVYTNPELVRQKYFNATTMILITDSLSATERVILDEKYRFMVKFFNSASQIQYYLSNNPNGRILNNPTALEMTSCTEPYYYILNYNQVEKEDRKLHIDTIFGEIDTIKIATTLNSEDWDSLVENMVQFEGEQRILEESTFHFDVIEVRCKLPLLLNLYYVNPTAPKISNLVIGDMSILSLEKGEVQALNFKTGESGPFTYSFNIYKKGDNPNIEITFEDESTLEATKNGVYTKDSLSNYERLIIHNKDSYSVGNTRVIFKFGYVIESKFKKIENNIYSNQNDLNRTINLFGYKYDTTAKRLNYTGIDFEVQTTEDNVKFCYSTNLGTFIIPSLQNCFRVGRLNPYTISTSNPLVMYKDYYNEDVYNYYVGFRTNELNQNITIIPKLKMYDTKERNLEGSKNKLIIPDGGEYSTILTAPKKNEPYIFTHIHVCTKNQSLSYQFLNAYNSSNLGYNGEIVPNSKFNFKTIDNTKLDTELKLFGKNGVEVFVKHVGVSEKYQPNVNDIKFGYNKDNHLLNWTQPIEDEEFIYTIYIDKINNIKSLSYTLCSFTEVSKLAHYSEVLRTNSRTPNITIDFTKPELKEYNEFDVIIVAEQVNNGKLTLLSAVYDSNGDTYDGDSDSIIPNNNSGNSTGLIVLIVILSLALIGGCIATIILYCKFKSKGQVKSNNKETSMAMIKSAQNDKLVESQAANQIDP